MPSPLLRAQYDLDLLCSLESVHRARQALVELGFESMSGDTGLRADHLPAMARKTGWLWKGDYFDPEMPPVVELHFRLWDPATERFQVEGTEQFPARSAPQLLDRQPVPGFCIADQLGYAALHALRHLLRGDLKACHVYELAFFMEKRRTDDAFWAWMGGSALSRAARFSGGLTRFGSPLVWLGLARRRSSRSGKTAGAPPAVASTLRRFTDPFPVSSQQRRTLASSGAALRDREQSERSVEEDSYPSACLERWKRSSCRNRK